MLGAVVETKNLVETVVASLVAGLGVATAFSILIFGATRFADLRRDDRPLLAVAAGALGAFALAVVLGSIVVGIVVMTKK